MHNLLANMRLAFTYIDKEMLNNVITKLIRPTMLFADFLWNHNFKKKKKKHIEK